MADYNKTTVSNNDSETSTSPQPNSSQPPPPLPPRSNIQTIFPMNTNALFDDNPLVHLPIVDAILARKLPPLPSAPNTLSQSSSSSLVESNSFNSLNSPPQHAVLTSMGSESTESMNSIVDEEDSETVEVVTALLDTTINRRHTLRRMHSIQSIQRSSVLLVNPSLAIPVTSPTANSEQLSYATSPIQAHQQLNFNTDSTVLGEPELSLSKSEHIDNSQFQFTDNQQVYYAENPQVFHYADNQHVYFTDNPLYYERNNQESQLTDTSQIPYASDTPQESFGYKDIPNIMTNQALANTQLAYELPMAQSPYTPGSPTSALVDQSLVYKRALDLLDVVKPSEGDVQGVEPCSKSPEVPALVLDDDSRRSAAFNQAVEMLHILASASMHSPISQFDMYPEQHNGAVQENQYLGVNDNRGMSFGEQGTPSLAKALRILALGGSSDEDPLSPQDSLPHQFPVPSANSQSNPHTAQLSSAGKQDASDSGQTQEFAEHQTIQSATSDKLSVSLSDSLDRHFISEQTNSQSTGSHKGTPAGSLDRNVKPIKSPQQTSGQISLSHNVTPSASLDRNIKTAKSAQQTSGESLKVTPAGSLDRNFNTNESVQHTTSGQNSESRKVTPTGSLDRNLKTNESVQQTSGQNSESHKVPPSGSLDQNTNGALTNSANLKDRTMLLPNSNILVMSASSSQGAEVSTANQSSSSAPGVVPVEQESSSHPHSNEKCQTSSKPNSGSVTPSTRTSSLSGFIAKEPVKRVVNSPLFPESLASTPPRRSSRSNILTATADKKPSDPPVSSDLPASFVADIQQAHMGGVSEPPKQLPITSLPSDSNTSKKSVQAVPQTPSSGFLPVDQNTSPVQVSAYTPNTYSTLSPESVTDMHCQQPPTNILSEPLSTTQSHPTDSSDGFDQAQPTSRRTSAYSSGSNTQPKRRTPSFNVSRTSAIAPPSLAPLTNQKNSIHNKVNQPENDRPSSEIGQPPSTVSEDVWPSSCASDEVVTSTDPNHLSTCILPIPDEYSKMGIEAPPMPTNIINDTTLTENKERPSSIVPSKSETEAHHSTNDVLGSITASGATNVQQGTDRPISLPSRNDVQPTQSNQPVTNNSETTDAPDYGINHDQQFDVVSESVSISDIQQQQFYLPSADTSQQQIYQPGMDTQNQQPAYQQSFDINHHQQQQQQAFYQESPELHYQPPYNQPPNNFQSQHVVANPEVQQQQQPQLQPQQQPPQLQPQLQPQQQPPYPINQMAYPGADNRLPSHQPNQPRALSISSGGYSMPMVNMNMTGKSQHGIPQNLPPGVRPVLINHTGASMHPQSMMMRPGMQPISYQMTGNSSASNATGTFMPPPQMIMGPNGQPMMIRPVVVRPMMGPHGMIMMPAQGVQPQPQLQSPPQVQSQQEDSDEVIIKFAPSREEKAAQEATKAAAAAQAQAQARAMSAYGAQYNPGMSMYGNAAQRYSVNHPTSRLSMVPGTGMGSLGHPPPSPFGGIPQQVYNMPTGMSMQQQGMVTPMHTDNGYVQPMYGMNPVAYQMTGGSIMQSPYSVTQMQTGPQSNQQQRAPPEPSVPVNDEEIKRKREAAGNDPRALVDYAKWLLRESANLSSNKPMIQDRKHRMFEEAFVILKEQGEPKSSRHGPGYPEAQYFLAECYRRGAFGSTKNVDKAFVLYTKASKQGHMPATYQRGLAFEFGLGTKVQESKALTLYRTAASGGVTAAALKLGVVYQRGLLKQKINVASALLWLKRAAADVAMAAQIQTQQDPTALVNDGAEDDVMATRVGSMTSKNVYALHACWLLGNHYEKSSSGIEIQHAYQFYLDAAELHYAPAMFKVAMCLKYGLGVDADPNVAAQWFDAAKEAGITSLSQIVSLPLPT